MQIVHKFFSYSTPDHVSLQCEIVVHVEIQYIKQFMTRTGISYDSHRLAAGRRLILGGVEIPYERGLQGHSDADALCHALCDALLGAAADGDIGRHFPDNDPKWQGADSTQLLRMVVERLQASGWRIGNTDATIIAEAPKLAPFVPQMRTRLAEIMGIEITGVSVKAKTNEGMDATGRGEGISVMAVATIYKKEA